MDEYLCEWKRNRERERKSDKSVSEWERKRENRERKRENLIEILSLIKRFHNTNAVLP